METIIPTTEEVRQTESACRVILCVSFYAHKNYQSVKQYAKLNEPVHLWFPMYATSASQSVQYAKLNDYVDVLRGFHCVQTFFQSVKQYAKHDEHFYFWIFPCMQTIILNQ
jgi:hypothetical protein